MQKYKETILYLVFIMLGFVFALIKLRPELVDFYHIEKSLHSKNIESADLNRKLDALKASEMQKMSMDTIKNIYKPSTSGGSTETSFIVIFDDIIEMAKYNGVKIYSIEYNYNPEDDTFVKGAADKYNVCELKTQVVADYPDLGSFLRELYKYPYLINIEKFELIPYQKDKKILLVNLQLKLYASK